MVGSRRFGQRTACLLAAALAGFALAPVLDRLLAAHGARQRVHHAARAHAFAPGPRCAAVVAAPDLGRAPALALASWQSIGGCGAGASTGTGGGVKWIGRNVRGGLVHVECQGNYVAMDYGYNFVATSLVSYELSPRWNLAVSVPYLYKYMDDPYKVGVDLANKGPGDVSLLATRRFGATNNWAATLSLGLPTGSHEIEFRSEPLPQDRQLGLGRPPVSLVIDHTIDNLWGPIVLGGSANWRGGSNELGSERVPSGSLYGYASYLVGPFAPAAGVSVTGFAGKDRDRGQQQAMPSASVAANLSLEWSMDLVAILLGASFPYDLGVTSDSTTIPTHNRLGAWTLALGVAFAPF